MKKVIQIDGMSCNHCKMTVEKALAEADGVSKAVVDLNKKTATVTCQDSVADDALKNAVSEAGFEPLSVTEKKGLFG